MDRDCTRSALLRIADALGTNQTDAFRAETAHHGTALEEAAQSLELLQLFAAIRDPKARLDCIAYLRGHARILAA